jgi:hypothetical protein
MCAIDLIALIFDTEAFAAIYGEYWILHVPCQRTLEIVQTSDSIGPTAYEPKSNEQWHVQM